MRFLFLAIAGGFILTSFIITAFFTTPVCFLAGKGTEYPRLQDAIRAAQPGCTLIVLSGEYRENLLINKPIRMIPRSQVTFVLFTQNISGQPPFAVFAAPARPVVIEAADPNRPVIEIRAEGVEIRGLTLRGGSSGVLVKGTRRARLAHNQITGNAQEAIALIGSHENTLEANQIAKNGIGIALEGSHKNTIVFNKLEANGQGISLKNSHENKLYANRVLANANEGILLKTSDRNAITSNKIERNSWGLVMLSSRENTLKSNRLKRNGYPWHIWGEREEHFVHRISRDNTIEGRAIYYLVGERNIKITSKNRPALVTLVNCEGITIEGITLSQGVEGLILIDTRNSLIRNNVLINTLRGIYLMDSSENELVGNRVERSTESGVTLLRSHANRLLKNAILLSTSHGVLLESSEGNDLIENEITKNGESGVHLKASRKATLRANKLQENWVGVFLEGGGSHLVERNWIANSQFGIFVYQATGNRFLANRLENNRHDTNASLEPPPPPPEKNKPPSDEPAGSG